MKNKKFLDRVLVILALFLFAFTVSMIIIFCVKDSIPDTLIISVFGACTGEVSICGWIKAIKEKSNETISNDSFESNGEDNL